MDEIFEQEPIEKAETVNVEYTRPKFVHRVLANFIDILVFIFLLISTFIIARLSVTSTSMYKNNYAAIQKANLESGLYVNVTQGDDIIEYKNGDEVRLVTSYMLSKSNLTYKDICNRSERIIKKFFTYLEGVSTPEISAEASKLYDDRRLALTGDVEGHEHYFEKDEDFDIQEYCNSSFGIFSGEVEEVILQFTPETAEYVLNYHFHPTQTMEKQKDGSVIVKFQASGSFEIVTELLKWRESVKIISPKSLKEEYEQTVKLMYKNLGM